MTELEQTLAKLLREWQQDGMACGCSNVWNPLPQACIHCRTRDALALYDRTAQEIDQERATTSPDRK